MINWEILDNKFGKSIASQKFEDMALDYVSCTYSEYTWKPTGRTRDGNKDFHNLESELFNIWGEAKYKKNSTSLTKKDIDPTILSGLIDGTVELIIFVTNGKIPEPLIDRMIFGTKIKGIKLSFVLGHQLADWLIMHPKKYRKYFEEDLSTSSIKNCSKQSIEIKRISFFETVSIDFEANIKKHEMLVGDTHILSCIIATTHKCEGKFFFENDFPFSIIENRKYDNPNKIILDSGINIINFMVRAKKAYNSALRVGIEINTKRYFYVINKVNIKENRQLAVVYFEQLNILNSIKKIIDNHNFDINSLLIFIHGKSGMGKSHILNTLSHDYSFENDITLVSFEKSIQNNTNYLLLCRILIFLQYGNLFWNYSLVNLKKICLSMNKQDVLTNNQLSDIIEGCFDANIAKTAISALIKIINQNNNILLSKKHKHFRILLLDDTQFLVDEQSEFLKLLILQQMFANNNNIIIIAGAKGKFYDESLEQMFISNINNYFSLDELSQTDIESTIKANISILESNLPTILIKKFPTNLLVLIEVLYNFKYTMEVNQNYSINDILNHYIEFHDTSLVFQNRYSSIKEQYYLLDIIYLFKKGISKKLFYKYPLFNNATLDKDFTLLANDHFVKFEGANTILPYHDFITEGYKKLRKGKEYNKKTGDFVSFLLKNGNLQCDTNYLLNIICKCGNNYFKIYKQKITELMLKYVKSSQYGTAIYFAEIFYSIISNKKVLNAKERYFLYIYVDCLVHSDNKYRAKELLEKISDSSPNYSFEKYESSISLLNQRFWSIDIDGLIEDTIIYQKDLENMFMYNMAYMDRKRFIKAYEACFNRRMVTLLLIDEFELGQNVYQEGLKCLKNLSEIYDIEYMPLIATLIMDYARGNMASNILLANRLLKISAKIFQKNRMNYVRRYMICQVDLLVTQHILKRSVNYILFDNLAQKIKFNEFSYEYVKAEMKICACRLIDYSKAFETTCKFRNTIQNSTYDKIIEILQNSILESGIILKNREKFMYNYLMAYIYSLKKQFSEATKCLSENLEYIKKAGETYLIPIKHNLKNIKKIKKIEWFQRNNIYTDNVYIIESRFW